tara:strand:- start:155 stop:1219 length:1065 start_codon:yes stop_codon:yes gene_type:complete
MKNKLIEKKVVSKLIKISSRSKINFFGRANSAIWTIASYLKKRTEKRTIILPSTMCISPSIIFLVNGFKLLFIDVEKKNGLLNIKKTKKQIKKNHDIAAIFYVNLFGNKDTEASQLKKIKDILVIQDLAQTFLNKKNYNKSDIFGDMIILSFGYSKIFDLNHGGVILSDNYDFYNYAIKFDKKIKNNKVSDIAKSKYLNWYNEVVEKKKKFKKNILHKFASKLYLIKFNKNKIKRIFASINKIEEEYQKRKKLLYLYKKFFSNQQVKFLHSKNTLIPWRFSFLIENKENFLKNVRNKGYDASSYYPNLGRIFSNQTNLFINSDNIEKKIVNLWLTNDYNIKKIKDQSNILKDSL